MTDPVLIPELLAPAGSPEALRAAVWAGADAVYLGGIGFNARANAKNFDAEALSEGIRFAHAYGARVYLTLNTLVYDRELDGFLRAAEQAYLAGADALIVADLGGAALLRRYFPEWELHASTQMSAHSAAAGEVLRQLGFSRMVIARETSREDLLEICRRSPIEIELFVHGAHCVSHSGQCLFSSLVGGRSGNRGECAQPCRLPYGGRERYPLSLKDLSLAEHIPELIGAGVSSLKIEGRMKAPGYVYGVTEIYRRLLDERRGATEHEMRALADLFSRGGFTDGYYTGRIGRSMLGVRSEQDKRATKETGDPVRERKIPLAMHLTARSGEPIRLSVRDALGREAVVEGPLPEPAVARATTREDLLPKLARLGGTPFEAVPEPEAELEDGLLIPFSAINALRRDAVETLLRGPARVAPALPTVLPVFRIRETREPERIAVCASVAQVTERLIKDMSRVFLSLESFGGGHLPAGVSGVALPPVIFDHEQPEALALLHRARKAGCRYALTGNLGHLALVREAGLVPVGDFRLNLTNRESVLRAGKLGVEDMILSPELTLPRLRDLSAIPGTGTIVYGRIPLMVTEKCVGKELGGCDACTAGGTVLTDRVGAKFPVRRVFRHRSVIYNSVPTYMADRAQMLVRYGITTRVFLFTTETAEEVDRVLLAYEKGTPPTGAVRRIAE